MQVIMAEFKPLPPFGEQHKAVNNHPITPPKKLVDQWFEASVLEGEITYDEYNFANLAARWGANQELDACCEEMKSIPSQLGIPFGEMASNALRSARRPKPPSQAEEALGLLNEGPVSDLLDHEVAIIRRALERLREHEQQVEAQVND